MNPLPVRTAAWLAGAALACTLAAPAHAQYQDRSIRASVVLAKEHSLGQAMQEFAKCTADRSGGKMKVQNFYDGALGGDLAVIQQLRSGTVDIVVTSPSYFSGMVPAAAVFDLPFFFATEREAHAALDGKAGKLVAERMPQFNLVVLAWYDVGFRHTTNSKHPIRRLEDFNGVKVRTSQNPVVLDTFKALNGNAVAMPFAETYSAMETRTIDGQENSISLTEQSKFNEVQKFLSLTGHAFGPAAMVYSKPLFDKLTPVEQQTVRECAAATRDGQRRLNRQQVDESLARMKTKGLQVNEIAPAEMARIRTAAKPVQEKYLGALGPEMTAAVQEDLKQVRGQ